MVARLPRARTWAPFLAVVALASRSPERIWIYDRKTLTPLDSFGRPGVAPGEFYVLHHMTSDSKGNLYSSEVEDGRRIQNPPEGFTVVCGMKLVTGPKGRFQILLRDQGVVNDVLAFVGIGRIALYKNIVGVTIGIAHILLPFAVMPMYGTMSGIDRRLLLAAESLGAHPADQLIKLDSITQDTVPVAGFATEL